MTETIFINPETILLLAIILIRDMVWRGIALWKAGTQKDLIWFICLFIFNTMGILPIIYIIFFSSKSTKSTSSNNKTTILQAPIDNIKSEIKKPSKPKPTKSKSTTTTSKSTFKKTK